MEKKNNHAGHRARMRETFKKNGFDGWQMHQVLEYLLFEVIPRADTNDMAHELINNCGGFSNVFHASQKQLKGVDGVGDKTAEYIHMLGEFVKYYNTVKYNRKSFVLDSETCENYMLDLFEGKSRECFFMICLDPQYHILNSEQVFEGSFESMDVDIAKIIRIAIKSEAKYVVFAHNHPSGIALASNADIVSTKAVERALYLSGVTLLDHIIVADGKCLSMRAEGHIK